MPYCPKCRYEYEQHIVRCPDCDVVLVSQLPAEPLPPEPNLYNDWVPLVNFTSNVYASMVREAFEQKQIPVAIYSAAGHFGQTGQMGPSSAIPVGAGYAVMVPKEFIAVANEEGEAMLGDVWIKARAPEDMRK